MYLRVLSFGHMLSRPSIPLVDSDTFREIFQSMSEGIIIVNESGQIVIANPVAEQMFGYEKDGLNGMDLEILLPQRYRGRHMTFRQGFYEHPEPRRMDLAATFRRFERTELNFQWR